ncbi:MAG: penicillin-binding protein 2 [Rubrobacteraceae bacterium]|uniref:peptidoglycan D,D-transpeptidase FtsI family protein n=1 Tax=Rubrobacter naiadicus TaxID=1392641 RepID=UPI00236166FE|nr:penicillin-binding protein 2 [Rubrobacter naiadicus]MBX6763539.1 penicillin-binding protein 2 [Rubrobacteraceae bacterium]
MKTGRGRRSRARPGSGRSRLRAVAAGVAVAGILLGSRAAYLSLDGTGAYRALASEQAGGVAQQDAAAGRGSILGAGGQKLATSVRTADVVATPYQIKDPKKAAAKLARVLGGQMKQKEIEGLLTKRGSNGRLSGYSVVARNVDLDVARRVRDLGIEGIYTMPDAKRVYPDGDLASQLLGYYSDYGRAYGGVEATYDKRLSKGQDVRLTINAAVQQQLQKALSDSMHRFHARSARGLVMNVRDGSIVALANVPGYDDNHYDQAPGALQRDRVLTDPYEPGSTFKAFTVAAALQEGVITPHTTFAVPDQIQIPGAVVHDSLPHPVEQMTPAKVLQVSSNVGATKIAERLGGRRLYEYIKRFGFGKKTGIDLAGESPGYVPPYRQWSGTTIGNIPFGQGLTVTPLQLAAGYAAIANGGRLVTPHVVQGHDTKPGPRVISPRTSSIVNGMLQSVVDKGTGVCARIPGYRVAGKTGTAQKVDPATGTYSTTDYVASFIGFAPANDPRYLVLMIVDDPQGDIYGETVVAPYFREVMGYTLSYYNVPPDPRVAGVAPDKKAVCRT